MNPIRHTRKDELLTARMNMPGTGKAVYSEVLDAGQTGGIDEMAIVIEHEDLPALAAGKKITLTKKMAATLLKNGKIPVKGIFSEKTGKSYDATLVLSDDGTKTIYRLDFSKE